MFKFSYICVMINEYFEEKAIKKEHEKLIAWRQFYVECSNEWETTKIDHKIERFENRHFD